MYDEIEIDGEIIRLRNELPIEETGVEIPNKELGDTIDLSKKLGEIEDESKQN